MENRKIRVTGSGQLYQKRGKTEKEGAEWWRRKAKQMARKAQNSRVTLTFNRFQRDMLTNSTFQESWETRIFWNVIKGKWTNCFLSSFRPTRTLLSPS